ncbi:MAG: metalloregulator ArsR/SmtB family transcription factor [Bacteroidota bacterium]|nr:metalloregulator ArsR/SmtB family transcription factor [Bacteroidota bacterium]
MENIDIDVEKCHYYADKLHAIGHAIRIMIIEMLSPAGKKLSVTDIYTILKIDQGVASLHLQILKDNGIVGSCRKGRYKLYYLKTKELKKMLDFAESLNFKEE